MRRKIVKPSLEGTVKIKSKPIKAGNREYEDLVIEDNSSTHIVPAVLVAIRAGDFQFLKDWLKGKDATSVPLSESSERSAFETAIFENQLEIVEEFINAGADVNRLDRLGETPIFMSRTVEMAKLLREAGARLDIISSHGINLALKFSDSAPQLKWLYNESKFDVNYSTTNVDPLIHRVVRGGHLKSLEFILTLSPEIDALNIHELTPMFPACQLPKTKRTKALTLLLQAGADPNYCRKSDQMTVLKFAGMHSQELVELLEKHIRSKDIKEM